MDTNASDFFSPVAFSSPPDDDTIHKRKTRAYLMENPCRHIFHHSGLRGGPSPAYRALVLHTVVPEARGGELLLDDDGHPVDDALAHAHDVTCRQGEGTSSMREPCRYGSVTV